MPDLVIYPSGITFSVNQPEERQTINISAMIFNNGTSNAGSFKVQFWLGNPSTGTQINGNKTVSSLNATKNTTTV
jgi:hypothetical protein